MTHLLDNALICFFYFFNAILTIIAMSYAATITMHYLHIAQPYQLNLTAQFS